MRDEEMEAAMEDVDAQTQEQDMADGQQREGAKEPDDSSLPSEDIAAAEELVEPKEARKSFDKGKAFHLALAATISLGLLALLVWPITLLPLALFDSSCDTTSGCATLDGSGCYTPCDYKRAEWDRLNASRNMMFPIAIGLSVMFVIALGAATWLRWSSKKS